MAIYYTDVALNQKNGVNFPGQPGAGTLASMDVCLDQCSTLIFNLFIPPYFCVNTRMASLYMSAQSFFLRQLRRWSMIWCLKSVFITVSTSIV